VGEFGLHLYTMANALESDSHSGVLVMLCMARSNPAETQNTISTVNLTVDDGLWTMDDAALEQHEARK
jgi:hypothetical protein